MSSRSVSLTSTFLLLAAGGVAACDSSDDTQDEGFYCADANGVVVDEGNCDDNGSHVGGLGLLPCFIWHSTAYRPGPPVRYRLPPGVGGPAHHDPASRAKFGLPSAGRITNGTVKTSVVGKGGSGTHRSSSRSGG